MDALSALQAAFGPWNGNFLSEVNRARSLFLWDKRELRESIPDFERALEAALRGKRPNAYAERVRELYIP